MSAGLDGYGGRSDSAWLVWATGGHLSEAGVVMWLLEAARDVGVGTGGVDDSGEYGTCDHRPDQRCES